MLLKIKKLLIVCCTARTTKLVIIVNAIKTSFKVLLKNTYTTYVMLKLASVVVHIFTSSAKTAIKLTLRVYKQSFKVGLALQKNPLSSYIVLAGYYKSNKTVVQKSLIKANKKIS